MEIETGQLQSRAKLTDKFNVLKQALGFCSPASFFQFCLFSVSPRLRGKADDFFGGTRRPLTGPRSQFSAGLLREGFGAFARDAEEWP